MFKRLNEKRRVKRQKQLAQYLIEARKIDNEGLLKAILRSMPEIALIRTTSGMMCFVDVEMADGYSLLASGVFMSGALREMIVRVVARLEEMWGC